MKSKVRWKPIRPEVPFGKCLAVHPPTHFWEPVIDGPKDGEENCPHDHIVKMRNHKVGVAKLPVERRCSHHNSRQTCDQELEQKTSAEEHRRSELDLPAPHRADPIKDLDAGRHSDNHRGDSEEGVSVGAHSDCKHVVSPDAEADEADTHRRRNHDGISEDRFSGENGDDFGSEREGRNY